MSSVKRSLPAAVKLHHPPLPAYQLRPDSVDPANPFELTASTNAMKCVSTSRSVGTALWPAWAAAVCADSKKVASSSRFARSSAYGQ